MLPAPSFLLSRAWLSKGPYLQRTLLLQRKDVRRAREQWQSFLADAPPFPDAELTGRGIVILSGGLPYMVPAWVNIHMLRLTGWHSRITHKCERELENAGRAPHMQELACSRCACEAKLRRAVLPSTRV